MLGKTVAVQQILDFINKELNIYLNQILTIIFLIMKRFFHL